MVSPIASLNFHTISFLIIFSLLITAVVSQTTTSADDDESTYYDRCAPFNCGDINFTFPFSSSDTFGSGRFDCGLPRFQISCDLTTSSPSLQLSGRFYRIKSIYPSEHLVAVVDYQLIEDLHTGSCRSLRNLSISSTTDAIGSLGLALSSTNLTFFKCPVVGFSLSQIFLNGVVGNYSCSEGYRVYLWSNFSQLGPPRVDPVETPSGCELVAVPGSDVSLSRYRFSNRSDGSRPSMMELLVDVLTDGFPLEWSVHLQRDCDTCQMTGGRCGYDASSRRIRCFHKDGGPKKHKSNRWWKLIVGVSTGSTSALVLVVSLLIFKYRKRTLVIFKTSYFSKNQTPGDEKNTKQFIKNYQSTLLANYSYSDMKKMTNVFKEKIGEGGYGNVYRGKLSDGRFVAVKMLENYKKDSQNFRNEVATIGMIHHFNVIRLLGFSWDGSKQALIYEYMPNGSLGDLLTNEKASLSLGLAGLLEIALGVARGIEYLHNGCESRILHLDIKPQNILLDENLNPKISDFGLAKMYSRNKSAVTMTGARGTIGYIAPEIFMRNIGNPSDKSDVYSFGMLLLEMIGGRNNVEVSETSTSTEAYFPGYIYEKLIKEKNVELSDSVVEEGVAIERKMVMVGLWCIQINPKDRPSIARVVEMLCGNVEAIEMPPKPFFLSPPRAQLEYESTSIDSDNSVLPLTLDSQEI